jgi:Tfp pilus assembly protein PilW
MMVALGIFSICGLAMTSLYVFASRSLVSLANYAQLDISNRQAMDTLTAEIREATQVIDYTTNADMASITVISGSTNSTPSPTSLPAHPSNSYATTPRTEAARCC